jgi:hypothetical protein
MIAINRSIIEVTEDDDRSDVSGTTVDLIRGEHAYVLLGDPGLGKTTVFTQEAEAIGEKIIPARVFLELEFDRESCLGRTLFIDGLDETRAHTQGEGTVLGGICRKLQALGVPRFRLSCREADWLGSSDKTLLERILGGNGPLKVYRLMPLRESEVEILLRDVFSVRNPTQFVRRAEEMGLDALLHNPQTLKMLAKAVSSHETWPDSRFKAYKLACETLVTERNTEHNAAKRKSWPSTPSLLDAAGLICVVYLLANRSAIQFEATETDDASALLVREMTNDEALPLAQCLETNLFVATGEGEWIPAHRSIAEYLAARYLAQRIANGLPINRIASLMFGADGGVITSLRGLNAWLATSSLLARTRLIDVDPIGVLLYGDVKAFSKTEKIQLLQTLKRSIETSAARRNEDWNSFAFSALVAPDMAEELVRILRNPSRERADETVAEIVVTALGRGPELVGMESVLLETAKDASRSSSMRRRALNTYLKKYANSPEFALALIGEIDSGVVTDDDDELIAVLLKYLYPTHLGLRGALRYLRSPKASHYIGQFRLFWDHEFLALTSPDALPELLDALSERPQMPNMPYHDEYWDLARSALVRGVTEYGDAVVPERLLRWMSVVLGEYDHSHLSGDASVAMSEWLVKRPELHMLLIRRAVERLPDSAGIWSVEQRIHPNLQPPNGMARIWLELALKDENSERAVALFNRALNEIFRTPSPSDPSRDELVDAVSQRPEFESLYQFFFNPVEPEWQTQQRERERKREEAVKQRIAQFAEAFAASAPDKFNIQGLHNIAQAHIGFLHEARGDTPIERLKNFFRDDASLVLDALAALKATPRREDLPTAERILELHLSSKGHLLSHPLMVGLDLSEFQKLLELREKTLRAGLMASYTWPTGRLIHWRKSLAKERPELVADVFVSYAISSLTAGKGSLNGAHEIVGDVEFSQVANVVTSRILEQFPRRATVDQLHDLKRFIKKMLAVTSSNDALAMLETKLALKVVDAGQRTYWLTAGLHLDPKKYEKRLRKWVEGNEVRIGHLGDFLNGRDEAVEGMNALPESSTSVLIELLAPRSRPDRPDEGFSEVTPDMQRGELIARWVNELSANPSEAATAALARLASLPTLSSWSNVLHRAIANQMIVRRDANFRFASVADVITTLSKGKPANVADLYAIVIDELDQITTEIERDSLDLYKQFWNVDKNNNVVSPKPEEACRDALCALMRVRLVRYGIDCPTESRHADRKRSDVWFTYDEFGVPAEVKLQTHRELWSAIGNQLITKYTIDPRAAGYGIYVVFWQGADYKLVSPTVGIKPKHATELRDALKATIVESSRHFIHVKVIDVSRERLA